MFEGIQIINIPDNIELISTKTNLTINNGYNMSKNENFTLSFQTNEIYEVNTYIIEFALIATEGNYEDLSKLVNKSVTLGDESASENYGGEKYVGRTSYYNISIEKRLTRIGCNIGNSDACSLCIDINNCVTCKYVSDFENTKICKEKGGESTTIPIITTTIPLTSTFPSSMISSFLTTYIKTEIYSSTSPISSIPTTTYIYSSLPIISTIYENIPSNINILSSTTTSEFPITSSEIISNLSNISQAIFENFECNKEQIFENNCNEGTINDIQIKYIHDNLINSLKDFNNTNRIIETKNVVFQISTLEQQKII